MKSTIITIGGPPGSGKSTIAERVADELGYGHFSSGDFMRKMAKERGLTLAELLKKAEDDPEIDKEVDARNKRLAEKSEIVVDSRLAFHFIPESLSVYLDVSIEEAARRIHGDHHEKRESSGEHREKIAHVIEDVRKRLDGEKSRYRDLYKIDHTNHDHYDLVIDTETKNIEEVTETVLSHVANSTSINSNS